MEKRNIIIFFVVVLFLSGCITRLTDFTIMGTNNIKVPENVKILGEGQGRSCTITILFFPISTANLKEAIDKAIESKGGDILIDATVYVENQVFYVYNSTCYLVKGKVGKTF